MYCLFLWAKQTRRHEQAEALACLIYNVSFFVFTNRDATRDAALPAVTSVGPYAAASPVCTTSTQDKMKPTECPVSVGHCCCMLALGRPGLRYSRLMTKTVAYSA